MLDKIKKYKDLFKKFSKTEATYDKSGIKPTKDWRIILIVTSVVLFVLGGVAGYFYFEVNSGNLFSVETDQTQDIIKINRTSLDKAVDRLRNNKSLFDSAISSENIPQDPSL